LKNKVYYYTPVSNHTLAECDSNLPLWPIEETENMDFESFFDSFERTEVMSPHEYLVESDATFKGEVIETEDGFSVEMTQPNSFTLPICNTISICKGFVKLNHV